MSEDCSGSCGSCDSAGTCGDQKMQQQLKKIKNKILVLSGKGGVGKSSVAANLAAALNSAGKKVGLLDIDFHGPSIPTMFHLQEIMAQSNGQTIEPVITNGLKIMSVSFVLPESDNAIIWRGPMKISALKQFLQDVNWGELDYLIMDFPPGTGDEPLTAAQIICDSGGRHGAIIVTTPQEVSLADCRKCIDFCNKLQMPILGVIENMSGFVCPSCSQRHDIFSKDGGAKMAQQEEVNFLGRLPLDPAFAEACDRGKPFVLHNDSSPTTQELIRIAQNIEEILNNHQNSDPEKP